MLWWSTERPMDVRALGRWVAVLAVAVPCACAQDQGWTVYGGVGGDHYSTLTQIDRKNAKNLRQAWRFDTGDEGLLENTPLVVGRMLYAVTFGEKVIALDGATGKLVWRFDPGVLGSQPVRGVSFWRDGAQGRILVGVMNFLFELDAETGKPVESFGRGGRVDLREGLDTDPNRATVAMTTPGVVYQDTIIVGFRAPETHPAPHGDIRAYDLKTGAMKWTFHTIPHPGEAGYETWPEGAWKTAGAANAWAGLTLDAGRGIVYAATGSAVDDFYGGDRVGSDLYANTLLALDAETGKRIWHFQGVHHDIWDRDFPAAPVLATVRHDGKRVDAVAQPTKQGYLYVFDRVTGKPLFPIEEMAVAKSDVPGEVSSPTQPHPLVPEPYAKQVLTEDDLTTRTPEAHAWALEQFREMKVGTAQFTPLALDKQTVVIPGYDGGAEWGGPAVDRKTGVMFINVQEIVTTGALTDNSKPHGAGMTVYLSQCAMCHGEQRLGSPPEFPSLLGVTKRLSNEQIEVVIHGGKGRMPSFPNVQGDLLVKLEAYLRTGEDAGPKVSRGASQHGPAPGTAAAAKANPHGAELFQQHCAICHGEQATGVQPAFPSLVGVAQRQSETQIAGIVKDGRGKMPSFATLPDGDRGALVRYLGAVPLTEEKKELEAAGAVQAQYRFTGYRRFFDPEGYPASATPWGTLNAIDLNTGKYLWRIPFGEYPELAARGMGNTGSANYGGPIVTASGVLFIAATVFDRQFHVYDTRDGSLLWHSELPFGGLATPTTYMIDGKQYVVIAAGVGRIRSISSGGLMWRLRCLSWNVRAEARTYLRSNGKSRSPGLKPLRVGAFSWG
jgi:glucose dehydrogenase